MRSLVIVTRIISLAYVYWFLFCLWRTAVVVRRPARTDTHTHRPMPPHRVLSIVNKRVTFERHRPQQDPEEFNRLRRIQRHVY